MGRTVLGEKNSFLCPPKEYADFVLEFEVWVDPKLNSGVQIRSESRPDYRDGVVHGYQIEIDPSERAWSGGIYDEQRRGWLASPKDDPAARKAFKVGEWNRYRVEANGDRLRTWVNDVPVSDLTDGMTRSGFIGFQVHQAKEAGLVVKWRNIRIKELAPRRRPASPRTRSPTPSAAEGWRLLWDGHTTWGWRGAKGKEFPKEGWEIEDGVLSVVETGGAESRAGGDIVTEATLRRLRPEARVPPDPGRQQRHQVLRRHRAQQGRGLGDRPRVPAPRRRAHPDAKVGRDGNRTLASLYDLIPAAAGKPVEADRRVERGADRLRRAARRALAERREGARVRARLGGVPQARGREQVQGLARLRREAERPDPAPGPRQPRLVPQRQDPGAEGVAAAQIWRVVRRPSSDESMLETVSA